MKGTGIVRKVDPVGRITIPSEIREMFNLKKGDAIELYVDGDTVILKKRNNENQGGINRPFLMLFPNIPQEPKS